MRRGIAGGYHGGRFSRERPVRPVLVLGCEGRTEENYINVLKRRGPIRVRPKAFAARHGKLLIDDVLAYGHLLQKQYSDAEVTLGVLYDLEQEDGVSLQEVREAVAYGQQNGVQVWVSVPTIERWFALHLGACGRHLNATSARRRLERLARQSKDIGNYEKPGSTQFFADLILMTDEAVMQCSGAHGADDGFACICELVQFIQKGA